MLVAASWCSQPQRERDMCERRLRRPVESRNTAEWWAWKEERGGWREEERREERRS